MRREDSNAIEARLRNHDRDAFGTAEVPTQEAPPPPLPNAEAQPFQDEGQGQEQANTSAGGEDALFAALGQALDEIEAEQKVEAREQMAPTLDRVELTPALDTMYKRMSRGFICSFDPPLRVTPREAKRHGPLINAFDKSLEELLSDSLLRARHQFEQRRAQSDGRFIGRNR